MNREELRELLTREGFATLFDGHPETILVFTPDGRFVVGNAVMMARGGYSAKQLAGMSVGDFVRSEDVGLAVAEFEAAAAGGRRQYVTVGLRSDGTAVRSEVTHVPFTHDGDVAAVITMTKDVGALEKAVAEEASTQRLLRTAGRVARFGGWLLDLKTSERSWSDEIYTLLGYSPDRPQPARDLLIRQGSPAGARMATALARCAETGAPFDVETDVVAANGSTIRLRVLGEAVRDDKNVIVAIHGAAVDVTEQAIGRRAEAQLTEVLASISDALLIIDRDWAITYLNPRAEDLLGTGADTALGKVAWDVFPQGAPGEFSIAYREALRENRTVTLRDFYPPLQLWLEATVYPAGEGLAVYIRDVTEAETVGRDLTARNAEVAAQSALLDNARDAIIVHGLDSTIRYWNAAAARIYGWARDEVIGHKARDVLYAEPEQFNRALRATMRDGQWSGDLQQVDKAGARLEIESSWTLVRDDHGEPESVFSVNTDVTEKRRREELDLRTQRMESLGTLASGIAHDLNNVLTPILMAVQLLAPGETDPGRLETLRSTETAVKRGADMIRQVLSFASGANGRRVPVEIAEVIDELRSLRREILRENIEMRFEVAADLWPTSGDPTQLLQVLMNLVTNARDAMPHGGTIVLRAQNVTLVDSHASISHLATPGDYVRVEVEDSGEGMTADVLNKIFEPFFTTKEAGAGTGLGLSTSIAIIRGHGGYMQAYSEPGRGSTFRLHVRADEQRQIADESANTELFDELPRGNGELVLVVDDEAAIRTLTRQTLDAYGYTTAVASNGAEAIDYIEAGQTQVDLVLTDMAMPVMDGAATAAYLLRNHPAIPVVAASGLNANGGVARARDSGVTSFLAKPYTTTELLRALAGALHPELETDP